MDKSSETLKCKIIQKYSRWTEEVDVQSSVPDATRSGWFSSSSKTTFMQSGQKFVQSMHSGCFCWCSLYSGQHKGHQCFLRLATVPQWYKNKFHSRPTLEWIGNVECMPLGVIRLSCISVWHIKVFPIIIFNPGGIFGVDGVKAMKSWNSLQSTGFISYYDKHSFTTTFFTVSGHVS